MPLNYLVLFVLPFLCLLVLVESAPYVSHRHLGRQPMSCFLLLVIVRARAGSLSAVFFRAAVLFWVCSVLNAEGPKVYDAASD